MTATLRELLDAADEALDNETYEQSRGYGFDAPDDAEYVITASTLHKLTRFINAADATLRERQCGAPSEVLAALKRYVKDRDDFCANHDGGYPEDDQADAGCIECTLGIVPNDKSTRHCRYHQAVAAIEKAEAA